MPALLTLLFESVQGQEWSRCLINTWTCREDQLGLYCYINNFHLALWSFYACAVGSKNHLFGTRAWLMWLWGKRLLISPNTRRRPASWAQNYWLVWWTAVGPKREYLLGSPTGVPLPGTNKISLTLFFAVKFPCCNVYMSRSISISEI